MKCPNCADEINVDGIEHGSVVQCEDCMDYNVLDLSEDVQALVYYCCPHGRDDCPMCW